MTRVLLAGVSTRGFAESAARAGYDVIAVDGFGDLDLRACATEVHVVRVGGRFRARAAVAAVRDVSCEAAVYEAGFENHPGAVRALAARRVLWGNPPAILARARDPRRLARVVGKAGLPAPRVRLTRPAPGVRGGWVVKPLHSGGGDGVAVWRTGRGAPMPRRSYFQERIVGVPGSTVFVPDGRRAVPPGLSGVLAGETACRADGLSMLDVHVRACRHSLPTFALAAARRRAPDAVGKAIVYARRPIALGDTRPWVLDADVRDISPPGTRFAPREPICTIFARGRDATACFAALARRAAGIYRDVGRREARSA